MPPRKKAAAAAKPEEAEAPAPTPVQPAPTKSKSENSKVENSEKSVAVVEAEKGRKLTKNEKRRLKEKQRKASDGKNEQPGENYNISSKENHTSGTGDDNATIENVEIEYVSAEYNDPSVMAEFQDVFAKFAKPEELTAMRENEGGTDVIIKQEPGAQDSSANDDEGGQEDEDEPQIKTISKKKKKLASRLSVAELKQLVPRPDVVEAHDVTAADPKLLVYLKSYRNTVPVPRHWCHKRKYLQGKRGIEKVPFQLPEWIAETGIAKIREHVMEEESRKKAKQKSRDRLQPKMGKIDIDYQVLHDAFFKYQKKPKLTDHGDVYYEGKEFELDMKKRQAGQMSGELMELLEMKPDGSTPPPWLVNMQRYGPPPSYPSMRIPGLNAPIPPGCQFGYQPGGWGKPPVDEQGRPLYGDVFGQAGGDGFYDEGEIDKTRWGEVAVIEEEEEESEEEEEEEDEDTQTHTDMSGMDTPSTLDGAQSMVSGLETPDTIDLRKRAGTDTPDTFSTQPKELYHVLQEKKVTGAKDAALFGSDHGYVLPGQGGVEMSINPDHLENQLQELGDQEGLREAYDAERAKAGTDVGADVADLDQANQKRKRRADTSMAAKRHKDFKF